MSTASNLAFAKSDGFLSVPSDATYYLPGRNPTIENLSLQRMLTRLHAPGSVEAVESLAGTLEGAFAVTYHMSADTHDDVRDVVFNDAGSGFTSGRAALSRWYLGADYLSGGSSATVERVLKGCIPLEYRIEYKQKNDVINETITMGYADEERNTTVTPGSVTGPSDGSTVPAHATTLSVDGATVSKLQSAKLRLANLYRFQQGAAPRAIDATLATPTTSLEAAAIYADNSQLELAYGSSGSSTTQTSMGAVSGSLSFDVGGTPVATYTLPKLKPDAYDWTDLFAGETDLTQEVRYHVNGGVSVA